MTTKLYNTSINSQPFLVIMIGDSLTWPRVQQNVSVENTYMNLLDKWWHKKYGHVIFWTLSHGGAQVRDCEIIFRAFQHLIGPRRIGTCIIHLGIADCAPRPLPRLIRNYVGKLPPFIRWKVIAFLHRYRRILLRIGWSFHFTSPSEFRRLYTTIIELACQNSDRVYVINIAPVLLEVEKRSPGLRRSIIQYNQIITEVASRIINVNIFDVYNAFQNNPELYLTDDVHITSEAHHRIYTWIREQEEAIIH